MVEGVHGARPSSPCPTTTRCSGRAWLPAACSTRWSPRLEITSPPRSSSRSSRAWRPTPWCSGAGAGSTSVFLVDRRADGGPDPGGAASRSSSCTRLRVAHRVQPIRQIDGRGHLPRRVRAAVWHLPDAQLLHRHPIDLARGRPHRRGGRVEAVPAHRPAARVCRRLPRWPSSSSSGCGTTCWWRSSSSAAIPTAADHFLYGQTPGPRRQLLDRLHRRR